MSERKRTVSKIAATVLCLLMAAMATSCGSIGGGGSGDQETLHQSIEAFNQAFRWEDYDGASVWVDRGKKDRFWAEVDNFKGKIRIVEFTIREVDHQGKAPTASAVLSFQYWRPDSPTLETAIVSQKWYFSETEKAWQLGQSGYQAITKNPTGF